VSRKLPAQFSRVFGSTFQVSVKTEYAELRVTSFFIRISNRTMRKQYLTTRNFSFILRPSEIIMISPFHSTSPSRL